ncbi:hypothetical protein ACHMXB_05285 [Arthrobacter sp. UC242_113]|uniref:hypothetical protein n=1 Tax=Arthrobacter sp. UC242_113 TaxID=3374550 RepID=UPI0037581AB3
MAHHKIQSFADLTTARVVLQNQFSPLEQERGLGSVLLGCKLLRTGIMVFGNAKIHGPATEPTA